AQGLSAERVARAIEEPVAAAAHGLEESGRVCGGNARGLEPFLILCGHEITKARNQALGIFRVFAFSWRSCRYGDVKRALGLAVVRWNYGRAEAETPALREAACRCRNLGECRGPISSRIPGHRRGRHGHHETSGTAPDPGRGDSAGVRHVRERR